MAIYYASPGAGGNGSLESPFSVADFIAIAKPGDTLVLLDGIYTGANGMIMAVGLNGTKTAPITICAARDGGVRIDGEGVRLPVHLENCSWIRLRGFDAARSSGSVLHVYRSSNCRLDRIVAWDADAHGNAVVIATSEASKITITDCAAFGTGRKGIAPYGSSDVVIRRCFARFEGSYNDAPKMAFSIGYKNYRCVYEDCIGTWWPWRIASSQIQKFGVFGFDNYTGESLEANLRLRRIFAYLKKEAEDVPSYLVWTKDIDHFWAEDVTVWVDPGIVRDGTFRPVYFRNPATDPVVGVRIFRVTMIEPLPHFQWAGSKITSRTSDIVRGTSVAGVLPSNETIWSASRGARLNRVFYNWPMNDRILAASRAAGYLGNKEINVNAEMSLIWGTYDRAPRLRTRATVRRKMVKA